MGLLRFALVGNYKRFYGKLKELSKENGKSPVLMFIDTALCTLRLGSGLQDYLNYRFYEKTWKERKTYATIGSMAKDYKTLAGVEYADFISNKVNFHKNYSKFTKRDFISSDDSFEKFEDFLSKHEYFVCKPLNGLGGSKVEKLSRNDIKDKKEFFDSLKSENKFLEELVIQNETWGKLSPNSTNTLRVVTTAVNDDVKIVFAGARIGSGRTIADNFHQGGQAALVDLETGKLVGKGIDKELKESESSVTGVKIDGYEVPYWEEIKKMVKEAALVNNKIHIIGWDVAIGKDGPLIIEGNRGPGFDLVQVLMKRGTKYIFEDLKKEIKMNIC